MALRLFKLFVLVGIPLLGALYAYQFTDQSRELVVPFQTFRMPAEPAQMPGGGGALEIPRKGPITVVNFWATWCPPCVEEFPAMMELQRQLEADGVELVFVSVDEKWEDVTKFLQQYQINVQPGRMLWDPTKELAQKWGSTKFPETYVLRRDGWVLEKIIGLQQWTRPAVIEYFKGLALKYGP